MAGRIVCAGDDIFSGENDWVEFDFSLWADDTLPLDSITVTCSVLGGVDPTPELFLVGTSVLTSSYTAAQHIKGAVKGVTYLLTAVGIVGGERRYAVGYIRTI